MLGSGGMPVQIGRNSPPAKSHPLESKVICMVGLACSGGV